MYYITGSGSSSTASCSVVTGCGRDISHSRSFISGSSLDLTRNSLHRYNR